MPVIIILNRSIIKITKSRINNRINNRISSRIRRIVRVVVTNPVMKATVV